MHPPKNLQSIKNSAVRWLRSHARAAGIFAIVGTLCAAGIFFFPATYEIRDLLSGVSLGNDAEKNELPKIKVSHLPTPERVKALYMTSWVAGTPHWRDGLVDIIDDTELNAIVIDVKDYTGRLSFATENVFLNEIGVSEPRIKDIREFIAELHRKGIYVIGRITVFQDPFFAKKRPLLAIVKESDKEALWTDYKGLNYLDPGAQEVWDYIVLIAKESYAVGFDELNFDYVRFPSDGNMRDIHFPWSEERVIADPDYGKAKVLRDFFAYLNAELLGTGAILSADLFGMTTTNADDLNIGQVLEYAAPYFDYLAPMVYPSHYPTNFIGFANPAEKPYEVVRYSMDKGVAKLVAAGVASEKLRPWLQDFDYKAVYGAPEVRAQIRAVYDSGLASWMLWDAGNRYTREALLDK